MIADHVRTARSSSATASPPSNEGRGYVLRRLLRRIIRAAKLLGIDRPIIGELMTTVRDSMGPSYPEAGHRLRPHPPHRRRRGDGVQPHAGLGLEAVRRGGRGDEASAGKTVLTGSDAFALHDTYGFPIELTLEMAAEAGLTVDEPGSAN